MRLIALVLLAMALSSHYGCSGVRHIPGDSVHIVPSDFSLELTVLTDARTNAIGAAHMRQSRYVVFPDGSFHHGEDRDQSRGADWLPPLTRVLTRRQVEEIWLLAEELGLTSLQQTDGALNFRTIPAPNYGAMYLLTMMGWGDRWSFARSETPQSTDAALSTLTRHLAGLAWVADQPPAAVTVLPRRYNFGPDPYARFRQPSGAPAADPSTTAGTRGDTQ